VTDTAIDSRSPAALSEESVGVLPSQWITKAVAEGWVNAPKADPVPQVSVQPASLDLRLGSKAYRIRASFLSDQESVERKLADYTLDELDISHGAILEPNRPYLIPLLERLALPRFVRGRANPKSSTGRLDIFTRVITDRSHRFDDIEPGYRGPMFLEVVSRTFTIRVRTGLSLNQVRLVVGDARVPDDEMPRDRVLFSSRGAIAGKRLHIRQGLHLSLDLEGDQRGVVGYRARQNSHVLDLSKIDFYDPDDFWEPVRRERAGPRVVLEPEEFYLLLSAEAIRVPADLAGEMTPYASSSGELRTHYAGFFDPGFGHDPLGKFEGSRAALEVRAHDVPFVVEQEQFVCNLSFERMLERPTILYGQDVDSNYQAQHGALSKHFRLVQETEPQMSLWRDAAR
jgi:dCTP deaminase